MSEPPALRIFIAYRRDDSRDFAGRIHDRLARRYEPPSSVFRDINDIAPGEPWEKAIDEAIDSCDVFVLLIGQEWLLAGPGFRWWRRLGRNRRINDPEDRHRREIEAAVGRQVKTFVVLMENAKMPQENQLPSDSEGLQTVPGIHALRIADHAFDPGIEQLIKSIELGAQQAGDVKAARQREPKEKRDAEKREREDLARRKRDAERKRRLRTLTALGLGGVALIVTVVLILPDDGPEAVDVSVGQRPVGLAVARGGIWVTERADDMVSSINATSDNQEPGEAYSVGESPDGVAVDSEGTVWVANGGDDTVSMLDPHKSYKPQPIKVGSSPAGIAVNLKNDSVWVANGGDDTVSMLDPDNDYERYTVSVGEEPYGVTVADDDQVWVSNRDSDSVSRIDPGPPPEQVGEPIDVGVNPKGIDATRDAVWVANTADGTVSEIKLPSLEVESFRVGSKPRGIVVELGSVWVSLGGQSQVARLDPETGDAEQEIDVGEGPEGIAAGPRSVWVANGADATVTRITP
jgi:YVTN family beta-propeller protein